MAESQYKSVVGPLDLNSLRPVNDTPQMANRPWGHETDAALGNAGAMLANIPAAFGSQSALDYKLEQEREAQAAAMLAQRQGIPQSFSDVNGPMDLARYAGHVGMQSLPATSSILAGGVVGGLTGGPVGAAAGAGSAAYTWALGDTLGNQYEQSGQYDLPSAAAYAVPYAAIDAFTGLEGRVLRGFGESAARTAIGRSATHGFSTAVSEGAGETFQEFMNSGARLAVDSNFDPFGSDAMERYKESFIGGALLGGIGGAAIGPFRSGVQPTPTPEPQPLSQSVPTNLFERGAMPGPEAQMELDQSMGAFNPYDVGGHVTAFQQGNVYSIDSPQQEMFGGAQYDAQPTVAPQAQPYQPTQAPTDQTQLPFEDEQVGFNPYDVGGHISNMQAGEVAAIDSPQQELFGTAPIEQFTEPQAGEVEDVTPQATQGDPPVLGALKQSLTKTFDEVVGKQPHDRRINQLLKVVAGATTKEEAKAKLDEAIGKTKDVARSELLSNWRQQFEGLMPEDVVTEAPVENTEVQQTVAAQIPALSEPQVAQAVADEPQAVPQQKEGAPAVQEEDREAKLNLLFKTAFGERNAAIARDVLDGTLTKAEIGKKHGVSGQRISQIGSMRAMAEAVQAAARKLGLSELQLRQLLSGEQEVVDQAVEEEVEQEVEEYYKPENGFGTTRTVGGGSSGWQDVNNIGKLADAWAKEKEAGNEKAAKEIEDRIKQVREEAQSVDSEAAARKLWESMANDDVPDFDELSDHLKDEWIENVESGHDSMADMSLIVEKHEAERSMQGPEYSHGKPVNGGSKAPVLRGEMKKLFASEGAFDERVSIVQHISELPAEVRDMADETTQGFTYKGRAYLIANNIDPTAALGVVLHEVGVHLGMEQMLGTQTYNKLASQIGAWAKYGETGKHVEFAKYAVEKAAQGGIAKNETIAYFVQRATDSGVTPTKLKGLVGQWMNAFYNAVRAALRKIGFRKFDALTPQQIVDLAFGAADMVVKGAPVDTTETVQKAIADSIPPQVRQQVDTVTETVKYLAKKGMLGFAFTNDVADMAVADGLKSAKAYMMALAKADHEKITFTKRIDDILDKVAGLKAHEQGTGDQSVNKYLRDSRRAKAWGYDDNPAGVTADPQLKDRFEKMSPQAQQIIKDIFAHGHETLVLKQNLVNKLAGSEFDAQLQQAQNEKERAQIEKKRAAFVKRFSKLMEIDPSQPYVPFKRFGNYVVVGSSQAYADAVEAKDSKAIAAMESDPAHREVTFVDSMGEAKALAQKLEQRFGRPADYFEKEQAVDRIYADGDMISAFERLRGLIRDQFGEAAEGNKATRQLDGMVTDLLLRTLAETTARKSELRFKDIAGADPDIIRAFASQGRADAHYIAAVTHNNEITTALGKMRGEAAQPGPEKAKRMQYLNEMLLRHAANMEYKPTPIQNQITSVTALWNLLLSPAYYVQNALQPLMISLPYMSGRHQYGRSWKFFNQAYKELGPMLKGAGAINPLDLNNVPADVKDAIHELVARGRIDIGIEQDLGAWANGMTSGLKAKFGSITHKLRGLSNKVETINRLSTAMAAYRLELNNNGGNKAAAIDYADKVIRVTHGDFTSQATPRYLKNMPLGKVITQFRRFQIMQLSMIARLFHNSFHGDEKWAARKALAYVVGHQMVMAGSLGMPAVSQIAWLFGALFGDDDEPNDPETKLRQLIGNQALANLILKGAPAMAGIDVSSKVGMGAVFSIMPYTDIDLSTRDAYAKTLMGISGPFIGGLLPNVTTGMGMIAKGDMYRGLEATMPALVRNGMRAGRFAFEGVTNTKGEQLMSPEEITFFDATAQLLGLPTTTITNQQTVNRAKIKYDQFYNDRSAELKKEFVKAYNKGDTDAAAAAREEWKELQDARARNGYKRQPIQELLSAPMKAKRKEVVGGVQVNKNNKQFVEALEE